MPDKPPSLLSRVRHEQNRKFIPDTVYSGLAAIGCSEPEIATLLGVTKEALQPKALLLAHGRARLKQSLRKAQIRAALKGNASMLIWLGKTYLGQSENPAQISQHTNIVVDAGLLSILQSSYQDTLADIRKVKELPPASDPIAKPRGNPNWRKGYTPAIANVPRGTISPLNAPLNAPLNEKPASHTGNVARSTPRGAPAFSELVTDETETS